MLTGKKKDGAGDTPQAGFFPLTLVGKIWRWFFVDFLGIIREMRWSYAPPLMVYFAAGVSGFTGIVESFYVKEELGLSAAFLAGLGFWAGLPWALKMPVGHLVDLFWRRKALFVYFGAFLMALSLLIMVGLTGYTEYMTPYMSVEYWYILSTLLAPIGFMVQDVVADAMTVEAVPTLDKHGQPYEQEEVNRMHVTMQTLGRIAIIGGSAIVAGIGGWLATTLSYTVMFEIALFIPVISVLGVTLGHLGGRLRIRRLKKLGMGKEKIRELLFQDRNDLSPNWHILGGSALFVVITLVLGLSDFSLKKEAIFAGSLFIVLYLMRLVLKDLPQNKRIEIVTIATIVFVYRAMPSIGAGASWWQIDVLQFDEAFFGTLRQIAAILTIIGLVSLRGWMSRRPISYLVVFLSIYGAIMLLPYIGMYHGLHLWTEEHLGFGARTIAIIDTMADSPLGQVMMVPMLAWIAKEAPAGQKATYFAVMAAFTNLALSAANLATSYVNRIFVVQRGDYSELGALMVAVTLIALFIPITTVFLMEYWQKRKMAAVE